MHSWTSHLRPLSAALLVIGAAGTALAATNLGDPTKGTVACCQLTTSLIQDVLRGKDAAGDERFFSTEGAPPNIHFLIDTSGSMRELPQISNGQHDDFFNDTVNGCSNARINAFQAANNWNPNFVYPIPDMGTGLGSDNGFPDLFRDDKIYAYMYWLDLSEPEWQWETKVDACQTLLPDWDTSEATEYALCQQCLNTKGYYKHPDAEAVNTGDVTNPRFIFTGRFLNFNPPKYVTARAVLKQVIKDLQRVRAGYSYFVNGGDSTAMGRKQNPSCNQIIADSSAFDNNRASYINGINGLTFTTGTPLARSLLNVGYYFTSDNSVYENQFGFGSDYSYPNAFNNGSLSAQGRSVCWGCQTSSVIIITDGEPTNDSLDEDVVEAMAVKNGRSVYCPDALPCGSGGIANRDKGVNPNDPSDDNEDYMLDDVAMLLANNDLQQNNPPVVGDFNTAGKQTLSVFTVGFGINSNLLRNAALVGNGKYYSADNAQGLKQALLDILNVVQTRATSFSSSAAATLNVREAGATLVPRFKPARDKTSPWQGFLYRFNLGPEKVLNCTPNGSGDLNNDGDCDDTHLIDKNGKAVTENPDGDFVQLLQPTQPATPFWEAGNKLKPVATNTTRWSTRKIFTIVDSNGDNKVDSKDTPIEFNDSAAGLAALRDYLGISDNPNGCNDIAALIGQTSLSPDACARLIIRWYRGADTLNPDPTKRAIDRPFLLHDIFHSSPISVEPPTPRIFCDFSNQCTQSLFSGSTPREPDTVPKPGSDAYDRYVHEKGGRDKIVLVGSNGGMLHAFHNGKKTGFNTITQMATYDAGTGNELWAFIPPDMLPKLRANLGKHGYFVDGTPMVREVWIDGAGLPKREDGKKQWYEYRTVAVVGSGRGGVHRFALDLTRLLSTNMDTAANVVYPNTAGDFLWMWPQPCDTLALQVGESFSNFAPRPPPIGPVALTPGADNDLRAMLGNNGVGAMTPWLINGVQARERWVVALNGGYDQNMSRGRGMAMVDLHTGHTLWSFFHGDGQDRSEFLKYPIGAGISMLDIGKGDAARDADLLFDTAAVGDYGGQLWMVRLWNPGEMTGGKITNWHAARAFRVQSTGPSGDPEAVRAPFSFMTTNTIQPQDGRLRTYIGTGDKENLLDKGSVCRLSNKQACAAQGCEADTQVTVTRGGAALWSSSANYNSYQYTDGQAQLTTNTNKACGPTQVTLNWVNNPGGSCTNNNDGSIQYTCDGTSTTWNCRETANSWVSIKSEVTTKPYPRRFYGLWTYGKSVDGSPNRFFNSNAEANAYDNMRLDDGDLEDVSNFDPATGQVSDVTVEANPSGKGWYLEYAQNDERTGGNGALVNGCMVWGSFEPSGNAGVVCPTSGTNKARLYQSHFSTGRANCASGFQSGNVYARYVEFTTVASTPEPVVQLTLAGGTLSRVLTIQGPGASSIPTPGGAGPGGPGNGNVPPTGPSTLKVRETSDPVKSLYQIELDRRAHDCRHEGIQSACD